jgi:hypothetical protein
MPLEGKIQAIRRCERKKYCALSEHFFLEKLSRGDDPAHTEARGEMCERDRSACSLESG